MRSWLPSARKLKASGTTSRTLSSIIKHSCRSSRRQWLQTSSVCRTRSNGTSRSRRQTTRGCSSRSQPSRARKPRCSSRFSDCSVASRRLKSKSEPIEDDTQQVYGECCAHNLQELLAFAGNNAIDEVHTRHLYGECCTHKLAKIAGVCWQQCNRFLDLCRKLS